MYSTRIPKESKIHFRYMSDTSRYMYLARFLVASLVSHGIHIIYQDTSGYMNPGLLIKIHQDTPRYKITILDGIHAGYNLKCIPRMYPERYVTEMQDTCARYIRDTFGIHVSAEVIKIYERDTSRSMPDTCTIHARYIGYVS
jgi:hypothetical protein